MPRGWCISSAHFMASICSMFYMPAGKYIDPNYTCHSSVIQQKTSMQLGMHSLRSAQNTKQHRHCRYGVKSYDQVLDDLQNMVDAAHLVAVHHVFQARVNIEGTVTDNTLALLYSPQQDVTISHHCFLSFLWSRLIAPA